MGVIVKKIVVALLIVIGSFGAIHASDTEQESSDAEKDAWLRLSGGIDSSPAFDADELETLLELVGGTMNTSDQKAGAGKRRVRRFSKMVREKQRRRPLNRTGDALSLAKDLFGATNDPDTRTFAEMMKAQRPAQNSNPDFDDSVEADVQYGLQDPQPLN